MLMLAMSLLKWYADTTELWVVAIQGGNSVKSRKLVTFDSNNDMVPFLDDIERELRLGGWSRHRG
jgi:hypothetical protein